MVPDNYLVGAIEEDCKCWGRSLVEDYKVNKKDNRSANQQQGFAQNISKKRIKVFIVEERSRKAFKDYLQHLKANSQGQQFTFRESLVDKRRKIPQTKIILNYFAGKCQKDNLLISYSRFPSKDNQSIAKLQLQLIQSALLQIEGKGEPIKLRPNNMILTKNGDGINVFKCKYDEYEIIEQLYSLEKKQLLTYKFKFPNLVKKFRQPEISEARKNNDEWMEEIEQLLENIGINREEVSINIQGYYKQDRQKGEILGQLDKNLRVDMNATLTTLNAKVYDKFKHKYDGKIGILGCEKLHVRVAYEQILTIPSHQAFQALKDEYFQYIEDYQQHYPLMTIQPIYIQSRNKNKVLIKARSPNKQDFLRPQKDISNLFLPKLVKLQASEFRFLDRMDVGNRILQQLQEDYYYRIYFGMDKMNNSLKVYCQDDKLEDIGATIKQQIKKYKYFSEGLSYIGKNLNRVKEILENQMQKLKKNDFLEYEILFQYKKIQITTDLPTFQRIKNEILKLSNSDKGECKICEDTMSNPYRLINCKCSFCWLCLTEHLRMFKSNQNQDILYCPNSNCNKKINMFDARTLLTQNEFDRICDIKIAKYISKNSNLYLACKYCENFFERKEVEQAGEINCQICGKMQCLMCKDYHPNYTCDEWRVYLYKSKQQSLGIKSCPTCSYEIQKKKLCNYICCQKCQSHVCWKCLKTFTTYNLCISHLTNKCGGVYDQ